MGSDFPPSKVLERPLLLPLGAVIAGIAAGLFAGFVPEALLLPLAAVTLLTLFLRSRFPFFLSLAVLLCCCGNLSVKPFIVPDLEDNHIARLLSEEPQVVEGVIDSRPESTEAGSRLTVQVEQVIRDRKHSRASGKLLVFIKEGRTSFLTGDRIRFSSRIQKPRNLGLPGEFDYAAYLSYRSIYATGFVKRADDIILMRQGVDSRLQRRIDAFASRIRSFIDATTPAIEASILRALLIGDMGAVPKSIKDAYSRTGVNHILSISGFHVGVIALVVFQILMAAARRSELLLLHLNLRRFILLVTLPLMVFYLFLSGTAPATSRSVIMIAVYILALVLEREVDPINSLLAAALFLLLLTPPVLFDISFQLSFLALWGIIVLTPLFMTPFRRMSEGVPHKLLLFLMASAAATAVTALPVAYYFHRVSATGLISNFFIVPLMGYGAVVLGFCAIPCIMVVPLAAQLLLVLAGFLVKVSNSIIMLLAKIPTLPPFSPSRFDLLMSYLLLCAVTFVIGTRRKTACCGMLACVWAGSVAFSPNPDAGKLVITFFSVGQGESTLITFPGGERMLVDGGGNVREGGQDVGERLLAPALWNLGVRKIDYMVLTHPHPDHMQGLKFVAANFSVGELWEGVAPTGSSDYDELRRLLAEHRVPVRQISSDSPTVHVGGALIEPLSPLPHTGAGVDEGDANDDSLVFRLVLGEFRMVFTGDIGFATEERLCMHPERLKCTVLKVPHHGSRYSSSDGFLDAAAPETALISAGYRNSFHLPAEETVDNLHRRKVRIFRTDLDGTVRIACDGTGRNFSCERWQGHFY